jgi:hypothetical protein
LAEEVKAWENYSETEQSGRQSQEPTTNYSGDSDRIDRLYMERKRSKKMSFYLKAKPEGGNTEVNYNKTKIPLKPDLRRKSRG